VRAITLTQPWATLVAIGAKRIETRSWATDYRGPLAIHAGMGLGPAGGVSGLLDLVTAEPFAAALAAAGIRRIDQLPRGAIVAVAEVADCVGTLSLSGTLFWSTPQGRAWPTLTDQERAFGDYSLNRYGWMLSDVRPLATPIPYRGMLGLWAVPDELEARIRAQMRSPLEN